MFEQVLLEYAVSFNQWKNGLKKRLIMEKVITAELKEQVRGSGVRPLHVVEDEQEWMGPRDPPENRGVLTEQAWLGGPVREGLYVLGRMEEYVQPWSVPGLVLVGS